MEIVLASNFDDRLVEETAELPVTAFFGNYPFGLTGGGRPPRILPDIDAERFREHLVEVHRRRRTFFATLNTSDLGLREYSPKFLERLGSEVDHLVDLGVDGFVAAVPALVRFLRQRHPDHPVSVSTFARVRSVSQAEYFQRMGADVIILEEANRDFELVRGLVRRGLKVEILVNQSCLPECPYRAHHLNTSSLASQTGAEGPWFEYPILQCGLEYVRDPARLVAGIFVRPEDLETYEAEGVHRFKISGRNRATPWLVRATRAYAARRYDGDLMDLLSYVQVKGPLHALQTLRSAKVEGPVVGPLAKAFEPLSRLSLDNNAFPKGFLKRIAATDCAHRSCAECGYCASVAARVMRIDGMPLASYRAPSALPAPETLLPHLAGAPPASARG